MASRAFDKQSLQEMNKSLRQLGEASRSWSNSLSSAFEKVLGEQRETVDRAKELEITQKSVADAISKQADAQNGLNSILEKQADKYKTILGHIKGWEVSLRKAQKETDSLLKKLYLGFGVKFTQVLQKAGKTINFIFSLKGALKLLKVGIGTAVGIFAGLVATAKSIGSLIYKHISGAFKLVSFVVKTSSGLVMSFFRKIWDTITMGGGEIRQAVAEMAQAFGMFNKTAGQAMGFLRSNWRDWYQMGLSIGDATKYIISFNEAYGHLIGFGNIAKKFYLENIKMARALGLEAEQAAKLSRTLGTSDSSLKKFAFSLVGTFGPGGALESMGVMIPEVARDIADSVDQLALYNDQGKKTFVAGAVWVRQYGFAIKDLAGMMDKFDTLSSATENVSKLNQMFGISVNAMELLVETDPAGRLEKVQQKLLQAGKSWESMDYFQKKSLASMMGLNAEQAQLVFSGKQLGKNRKEIAKAMEEEDKKQKESQKRQAEVMSAILAQLRASRGIMGSIMPLFYRLWVAFGQVFGKFLWGARRGALDFVEGWAAGIRKLAASPVWQLMSKQWVIRWRDTMKNFGIEWGKLWSQIDMKRFGEDFYGTIDTAISAVKKILFDLFPDWAASSQRGANAINDIIHGIAIRLQDIIKWVGDNGADIIRNIGRVAKGIWHIIEKVFNFFDKSNWGEAANIMKGLFDTVSKDAASILGYVDKTTGKMLTGFDPAVAAAKAIEWSYMKIRDFSIEIYDWWKKNGDDIKGFFKGAFETAKPYFKMAMMIGETIEKMLKWIGKFLISNPWLLKIIAVSKVVSFATTKLLGMGLTQIAGNLLGKAKTGMDIGVQQVYVTNAAEIGVAASGGGGIGGRLKNIGGTILTTLGRGAAGGAIGYGLGSALGQATGVPEFSSMGTGAGIGAGMGSMIGPLGTVIGGLTGAIIGGIKGLFDKADREKEEERQAKINALSETFARLTEQENKDIQAIIKRRTLEDERVKLTNTIISLQKENMSRTQQNISNMKESIDTTLQQKKLERTILFEDMKKEKDPKKKQAAQAQIAEMDKEIRRRERLNVLLGQSATYQNAQNVINLAKMKASVEEEKIRQIQEQLQPLIDTQKEHLEQYKATSAQYASSTVGTSVSARTMTDKSLHSITSFFQDVGGSLRALQEQGIVSPETIQRIQTTLIERQKQAIDSVDTMNPDEYRVFMSDILADVQNQVSQAAASGEGPEAKRMQENIDKTQANLNAQILRVGKMKGAAFEYEYNVTKAYTELMNSGITPDKFDAALKEKIDAIPRPAYAYGGLIKQATTALMGEAGPELAIPMRGGSVSNAPGTEMIIQDYLKKINPAASRGRSEDHVVVIPINIDGRRLSSALVRIAHQSV